MADFVKVTLTTIVLSSVLPLGTLAGFQNAAKENCNGIDRFYSFEFASALPCFRRAVTESATVQEKLENQYWLSKALWVRLLDQRTDVNEDFMTAVLDKTPVSSQAIDSALSREFRSVTASGIEYCTNRLKREPTDLVASYYLAALTSNSGAYKLLVENRRFAALSDIKRSMQIFKEVLKRDSSRLPALTLLGLGHYMVGTNPWYVRMFNPLIGLEGTRAQGLLELEAAARSGNIDAKFILKAAYLREGRLNEGLKLLHELSKSYPRNLSFRIQMGQVLLKLGRSDEGHAVFAEVLRAVKEGKDIDPRYTPARVEALSGSVGGSAKP